MRQTDGLARLLRLRPRCPHSMGSRKQEQERNRCYPKTPGLNVRSDRHSFKKIRHFITEFRALESTNSVFCSSVNAYGDDADPDNARAHERTPRADGHANAVRRAGPWACEHADGARHASADGRGPTVRGDANGRGVR